MAVYRRHAGGVWTTVAGERRHEQVQQLYRRLPSALGPRFARVIAAATERIDLWYGNIWLRDQLEQSTSAYRAGQAWIQELTRAKEWLLTQVQGYEELKRAHEALWAEARGYQERLETCRQQLEASARARAEVEAQNAFLTSALQAIEQSRGWRLVCLLRRLRGRRAA
jgi:hypothetical protein